MLRVVKTLKKRNALKKSIAIMYGTDDVVSKAVGLFIMKPIFEKEGVEISGPYGFSLKAFDVAPQVSQLKGKQLDYIGVAVLTNQAIRVLKELRRQGRFSAPRYGPTPKSLKVSQVRETVQSLPRTSSTTGTTGPGRSPRNSSQAPPNSALRSRFRIMSMSAPMTRCTS